MATQLLGLVATANTDIKLTLDDYYFSAQVVYAGFASAASIDASFKILYSNVDDLNSYVELVDSEIVVADSDGSLIIRNEKPLSCQYIILRYTKNAVNAGTFDVYVAPQTEIM